MGHLKQRIISYCYLRTLNSVVWFRDLNNFLRVSLYDLILRNFLNFLRRRIQNAFVLNLFVRIPLLEKLRSNLLQRILGAQALRLLFILASSFTDNLAAEVKRNSEFESCFAILLGCFMVDPVRSELKLSIANVIEERYRICILVCALYFKQTFF